MGKDFVKVKLDFHQEHKRGIRHSLPLLLLPLVMCGILFVSVKLVITEQMQQHAALLSDHFYLQSSVMLREVQAASESLRWEQDFIQSVNANSAQEVDDLALCQFIRARIQESTYIGHIYVVSERLQHIYSDAGSFNYRSLDAILQWIGAEEGDITAANLGQGEWRMYNRHGMTPYCVFPLTTLDGEPAGSLIITLKMTEFLRICYSLDAEICCVFNDSFYITSYFGEIPGHSFQWRDEQAVSKLTGTPLACFYFDAGSYTCLVGLSRSAYSKPLRSIILCFCLYIVVVLAAGGIYLYRTSKRRWRRLALLIDALPTEQAVSQPDRDLHADVSKSLADFRDQGRDTNQLMESRRLHHLLCGHYPNITPELLQTAGLPAPGALYCVALFFITDISELWAAAEGKTDVYNIVRVIFQSTLANLSKDKMGFASYMNHNELAVVFSSADEAGFQENAAAICAAAVDLIGRNYNISLQATLSSPVVDPNHLPEAFRETQKLHSFAKSVDSDVPLLTQKDMLNGGGALLNGDFLRQEQILINTLLAGKYSVVPPMASAILAEYVSAKGQNYSLTQDRLATIANLLSEGVLAAGLPAAAASLREADSVLKLNEVAGRVYSQLTELANNGAGGSGVVSRACKYIRDHMGDQGLSVSEICSAVKVSVPRLTRMFQASFDMTVAEYINSHRIALAKELLADKRLTVAQIAAQVGYNSTDTLTRNFRKLEGITPSEYRKLPS